MGFGGGGAEDLEDDDGAGAMVSVPGNLVRVMSRSGERILAPIVRTPMSGP